jgi:UDP-N-acetylmuramoylalanine--D-glutamate ligase
VDARLLTDLPRLAKARVTVMGLGLFGGGVGVTQFLCRAGARVTVTDLRSAEDLEESVRALTNWPVDLHLGGHREEDFRDADLVVVSPGVPWTSPWLSLARAIETEMNLFFKLCPTPTIYGVTGSNGKTTTTTLIGEILSRGPRKVWLGGNLGISLLPAVAEIAPDDIVVLELSSFQLEALDVIQRSPHVSVVLNITPNHLDRHGTMAAYIDAKRSIVRHQRRYDARVLNADDPVVRGFAGGDTRWFGREADVASGGVRIEAETLRYRTNIFDLANRRLRGRFNLQNMAAAVSATANALTGWADAAYDVLLHFPGVEHRLEFVTEIDGVSYYNDSIATTPERTLAALDTLTGPLVILLGGYDKKLSFDTLGQCVATRCRAAVLFGDTAPAIEEAICKAEPAQDFQLLHGSSFAEAVELARQVAQPGDCVVLSPACASYGMFTNFVERGRAFKKLLATMST